MKTTRSSLAAAFALAFLLVVAPAAKADRYKSPPDTTLNDHPSGNDRSVEPGKSGTQGKAASDPDAMTNGGADKPGMTGGFDSDKDGNNGCGNDDDFEDDNNGWCGHHPKPTHATTATTARSTTSTTPTTSSTPTTAGQVAGTTTSATVLGETLTRGAANPVLAQTTTAAPSTAAAPSTMARTGADSLWLAGMGLVLMALGGAAVAAAKRA